MHATFSAKAQETRILALEEEIRTLFEALGDGVDAEAIVKRHIRLLHTYNEAKDACQIMIGKLAPLKEKTIAQIHIDLDLPMTD